jgi:hypothetical protein
MEKQNTKWKAEKERVKHNGKKASKLAQWNDTGPRKWRKTGINGMFY